MPIKPDLTSARRSLEEFMVDTCVIKRDVEGVTDDGYDPDTLLIEPQLDGDTIYDTATLGADFRPLDGKIMFSPRRANARTEEEGESEMAYRMYNSYIPWDAPDLHLGDVVEITDSARDPKVIGRRYVISDVMYSTFLVGRGFVMELVRRASDTYIRA